LEPGSELADSDSVPDSVSKAFKAFLVPGFEGVLSVFGSGLRAGVTVAVAGVGRLDPCDVCIVHSAPLSVLMSFIE